jgi:hypothetical protein
MNPYSSNSIDIINQITLNCLIDKNKLAKINSKKNKQNLEIERNENMNKNRNELIELFTDLLNHEYDGDVSDVVNKSFVHFIDECLIYLNMCQKKCIDDKLDGDESSSEHNENSDDHDESFDEKLSRMMTNCIKENEKFAKQIKHCEINYEISEDEIDDNFTNKKKHDNNGKDELFHEDGGDY